MKKVKNFRRHPFLGFQKLHIFLCFFQRKILILNYSKQKLIDVRKIKNLIFFSKIIEFWTFKDHSLPPQPPARNNIPPPSYSSTPNLPSHTPFSAPPPRNQPQQYEDFSTPQPVAPPGSVPTDEEFAEVRKLTKYAMSAVDYEDVKAIRDNLIKALTILQKYWYILVIIFKFPWSFVSNSIKHHFSLLPFTCPFSPFSPKAKFVCLI